MRATVAPVRISAPKPRAAPASACVSAPMPPRTKVGRTRGVRVGRRLEEQAEAGARRPGAREGAVDAARRDDGAQELGLEPLGDEIGHGHRPPAQQPERVRRGSAAELARRRRGAPTARRTTARRSTGGVIRRSGASTRPMRPRLSWNSGSAWRRAPRPARGREPSAPRRRRGRTRARRPSGDRREDARLGLRSRRGRAARGRARGRSRPGTARAACASVETRKPGWNSSVTAMPPTISRPLEDERSIAPPSRGRRPRSGRCARRR